MTDLDESRVLEVVKDRTQEAADALWNSLPKAQREKVLGVAMDMWQPYIASTREHAPAAELEHLVNAGPTLEQLPAIRHAGARRPFQLRIVAQQHRRTDQAAACFVDGRLRRGDRRCVRASTRQRIGEGQRLTCFFGADAARRCR